MFECFVLFKYGRERFFHVLEKGQSAGEASKIVKFQSSLIARGDSRAKVSGMPLVIFEHFRDDSNTFIPQISYKKESLLYTHGKCDVLLILQIYYV